MPPQGRKKTKLVWETSFDDKVDFSAVQIHDNSFIHLQSGPTMGRPLYGGEIKKGAFTLKTHKSGESYDYRDVMVSRSSVFKMFSGHAKPTITNSSDLKGFRKAQFT